MGKYIKKKKNFCKRVIKGGIQICSLSKVGLIVCNHLGAPNTACLDEIEPTMHLFHEHSSENHATNSTLPRNEETSKDILSGDKGPKFVNLLYENISLNGFIPFYGLWPTDFFCKTKNYIGIFYCQQSYYLTLEEKCSSDDDLTKIVTIIANDEQTTKEKESLIIKALEPLSLHFETGAKYFIVANFKKVKNKFGVYDSDFFYSLLQIASWIIKGMDLDAIVEAYKYWNIDSVFQNFNLK